MLNGKINGNACIVVPLSTTRDHDKLKRGMHVEIASNVINDLQFFDQQIRWAKTTGTTSQSKQIKQSKDLQRVS